MGWSDCSISLRGPVVEDLRAHFVERWNFIYNEKYDVRKDVRYSRLTFTQNTADTVPFSSAPAPASQPSQGPSSYLGSQGQYPPPPSRPHGASSHQPDLYGAQTQSTHASQGQVPYFPPPPISGHSVDEGFREQDSARNLGESDSGAGTHHHPHHHPHRQQLQEEAQSLEDAMRGQFEMGRQYLSGNEYYGKLRGNYQDAGIACQVVRSCTKWSHGVPTEHSVANAYISVIENSRHFVYIENQFFITATSDAQNPVKNKVGAAIVERILRAARAGEKFKMIVCIPSVPGFAGDLKDDSSLGTRAIMEYQYNSINRGGHSIMEMVAKEGYDPTEYIRFYNLRNYDRINVSGSMKDVEQKTGVNYEVAREEHDEAVELPAEDASAHPAAQSNYRQYQQAIPNTNKQQGLYTGRWDSVSECYMLGGEDIRNVPWEDGDYPEIDAFVTEELYIHTKVCQFLISTIS